MFSISWRRIGLMGFELTQRYGDNVDLQIQASFQCAWNLIQGKVCLLCNGLDVLIISLGKIPSREVSGRMSPQPQCVWRRRSKSPFRTPEL